jgi:molybdenum cofactor biosynthesis protein B
VSGSHAHDGHGADVRARLAVVTVSDTRTAADDRSGDVIAGRLEAAGHRLAERRIVPDDAERIRETVSELLVRDGVDGVLLTGGTGISRRDTTHDVVAGLLDARLDGFGELFRMLSFGEIGSAAMLGRAIGGVARGRVVFAMPGSTAAVRLAMDRLILPELGHLLAELRKPG